MVPKTLSSDADLGLFDVGGAGERIILHWLGLFGPNPAAHVVDQNKEAARHHAADGDTSDSTS
jgi:hypothetical protein